jgi:hypothetical protein
VLAERTSADAVGDGTHGWAGLHARDAAQRARDLYRVKESEGLRFAFAASRRPLPIAQPSLVIIPDCGDSITLERPEALQKVLDGWL